MQISYHFGFPAGNRHQPEGHTLAKRMAVFIHIRSKGDHDDPFSIRGNAWEPVLIIVESKLFPAGAISGERRSVKMVVKYFMVKL